MEVIAHEAPGMELPVGFGAGFGKGVEEKLAILIGEKDVFAMIATVHEVIDRAGVLEPEFSGHAWKDASRSEACQY
jgi:hypothetical protein